LRGETCAGDPRVSVPDMPVRCVQLQQAGGSGGDDRPARRDIPPACSRPGQVALQHHLKIARGGEATRPRGIGFIRRSMLGREIGRPFERLLNVVVLRTNVANFRWAQSVPHVAGSAA
jgi:hypothetical protein